MVDAIEARQSQFCLEWVCGDGQVAEKVSYPSKTFQAILKGYRHFRPSFQATCWFNNSSTNGGLAVATPTVTSALRDGMLQISSIDLLTAEWGGCFCPREVCLEHAISAFLC